jgi:hypothetical protein
MARVGAVGVKSGIQNLSSLVGRSSRRAAISLATISATKSGRKARNISLQLLKASGTLGLNLSQFLNGTIIILFRGSLGRRLLWIHGGPMH